MALSTKREQAAQLVAEDRLSNQRIADAMGVSRQALDLWKKNPEFKARVDEIVQAAREAAMQYGIAVKTERIRGYQERQHLLWQLLRARAERGEELLERRGFTQGGLPLPDGYQDDAAPGVETGLLVRQEKIGPLGSVVEWVVDTGTLAEMRALEKQAAQELEQWTEKSETKHDGTDNFLEALRFFGAGQAPRPGSE